ncbi:MAG TPA: CoA transferase [Chloroflexota bacterium]|jgi:crotonobetainyl-CoA:carnitine CoA-transferase CaiB-like acyl-CoA transferase
MDPEQPPLAGVRIVAVEQYGAGPYATLYLADMGAEVIKIEDPGMGGDVGRYVPPGQSGTDSLFFESFNRGKRSLALDLKSEGGRAVLERLVAGSHAVFNNLRGDLPDRMGLTYASLGKINPAIVCASLSAYGRHGERAAHPGYDPLVQAEAGWASLTGEPEGPPVKSGLSLADYAAGLGAALALMIALFDVGRTGRGRDVDTSLYDMALGLLTYPAAWYLSAGIQVQRFPMSAHPSLIPFQFMQTADGYLAVACAKEKFFQDLLAALELPEVAADPRFVSFATRREHREELSAVLGARFRERTTAEWLSRLRGRVPCAPVRSLAEALDREELEEREMLATYDHPVFGQVAMTGTPFTLSGFRPTYRRAPAYNADQQALLDELGYSPAERAELAAGGAFGSR